ncbi:hypothetical protein [Nocardia nova]|uniref:hypothetical protein n=1 Tax=Nocardia nova TaxID=37330 RepID=UPI0004B4FF06|nr:hypothetical protein [Nocardia nova]
MDLVKTFHDLDLRMRARASRLGHGYIGLTRSSSLIVPGALFDHVAAHRVALLIFPDLTHMRGRIPPELVEITALHDLATGITYQ